MPLYEYKCKDCDSVFELRRPMSDANAPAQCAEGHPAVRLLSVFASVGAGSASAPAPASAPSGGGCCGGHCGCH